MISWKPISNRLLTSRFPHRHGKVTVIVAYSATDITNESEKDSCYDQFLHIVQEAPLPSLTSYFHLSKCRTLGRHQQPSLAPVTWHSIRWPRNTWQWYTLIWSMQINQPIYLWHIVPSQENLLLDMEAAFDTDDQTSLCKTKLCETLLKSPHCSISYMTMLWAAWGWMEPT